MAELRIGLVGTGRMGSALVTAINADPTASCSTILSRTAGPVPGRTGDTTEFVAACDVVIDFSTPERLRAVAEACAAVGRPLVSGTTGLDAEVQAALHTAAQRIPIVYAANMSIGINLLLYLVENTADKLPHSWHVHIEETHHRHKRDAPSGTALALGSAVERLRGAGTVEYTSHREGEAVGQHEVRFESAGERIVLGHEALDRGIFATGALRAAHWVVRKPPGLYGMAGVLGLE